MTVSVNTWLTLCYVAYRNILVDEKLHAKISDFGLSRVLAKEDTYYKLSNVAKLPVKWMALESIEYRKFSTFSDGKLCFRSLHLA